MPTPSLLIVPARFKSGKLYSQLPTSGAGDFTVTRATAATRVNASGLIESVASGIPRLDYFASGGTVGCPALLVEPSGNNINLYSQDFTNAWWTYFNASGSVSASTSPDGTNNALKLIEDNANGFHSIYRATGLTVTAGQSLTRSVFAKADGRNFISLLIQDSGNHRAFFNLQSGTIGTVTSGITARIDNYGNNWYRCSITRTMVGTSAASLAIELASADNTGSYQGNGTSGVFIYGAQLETGSIATSYIPTTTGSVTRNADVVVSVSGAVSGSIGQQSGTIYIECQSEFATNDIIVINTAGQSPGNNFVSITKTPTNVFRLTILTSGTTILIDQASAITSFAKIAVAYASGNTAFFINGTQIGSTNTTGFSFNAALNNISFIGNMVTGTKPTRIRAVALYTTRLSNAELQSLTTL